MNAERKGRFTLFVAVAALLLVTAMATGVAVGATDTTGTRDSESAERLYIRLDGRFPADISMPYSASLTGRQLAEEVAQRVGVKVQYLALFRSSARLVRRHGASTALTHMDRVPEYRIDAGPNADKTLQEQGVMAGDALKLLLRPLRGDHIHYAFSIYYKGNPVDMTMIEDRPVLAVESNISEQDRQSGDVCSPSHGPRKQTGIVAGRSNDKPGYVGPKIWEGNHIDTVFPHFGVHIGHPGWFGISLMHIHPATGWQWFEESEGLGANLDTLLEQVGIWVWEKDSRRYPFHTPLDKVKPGEVIVDFPAGLHTLAGAKLESNFNGGRWSYCDYPTNRLLVVNDKDYVWRLYYWPFSREPLNFSVLEEDFGRVWLYENMGMITLSYEKRDHPIGEPPPLPVPMGSTIEYLWSNNEYFQTKDSTGSLPEMVPHDQSSVRMLGFDGTHYPMPNMPCDFCRKYAKEPHGLAQKIDCVELLSCRTEQ
jgi:hypothetical protein